MRPPIHRALRAACAALSIAHLALVAVTTAQTPPAPGAPPTAAERSPQRWAGEIDLPGMKLGFQVTLVPPARAADGAEPAGWSGTISIPMQGLSDARLQDVAIESSAAAAESPAKETIRFTFCIPPMKPESAAKFVLVKADDGRTAAGTMSQGGMEMKISMRLLKEGEDAGPRRPQTPKPPFPYVSRDVEVVNPGDGVRLAGTLTIPEAARFGAGPHGAIVLLSGSGAQDRDSTLMAHKPFAVIADALTRAGVAVLRLDDRGVGGSGTRGDGSETTDDFAADARAALAFLASLPEIDPTRLGLLGHSEGGLVAALVAGSPGAADGQPGAPSVRFAVMLAGPALPGDVVLIGQAGALARAGGAAPEGVDAVMTAQRALIAAVKAGEPIDAIRPRVRRLALAQMGVLDGDEPPEAVAEQIGPVVDAGAAQVMSAWMRRFLTLDPRQFLRVAASRRDPACAILMLYGQRDLQVLADDHARAARAALGIEAEPNRGGGLAPDLAVEVFPEHNHLFQRCRTGSVAEYARIEETLDPAVLARIVEWVAKRAGAAEGIRPPGRPAGGP